VRASSSGGADGVLTLVTDAGLRFPVSSTDALSRLGYDAGSAVRVPQPFTSLLPAGPVLDTTAAAKEYSGGAVPPDGAHAGK
jgi:Type VII secretion system ESX-1, transport TM domain B